MFFSQPGLMARGLLSHFAETAVEAIRNLKHLRISITTTPPIPTTSSVIVQPYVPPEPTSRQRLDAVLRGERLPANTNIEALLLEAPQFKSLDRAGWLRIGIEHPESVASHSWHLAFLVILLLPKELDLKKALCYAILHDLAEVRVGDVTPKDKIPKPLKVKLEKEAFRAMMPDTEEGNRMNQMFLDYEGQIDPESRFVKQLDALDSALQAARHRQRGFIGTQEFVDTARDIIKDPHLLRLLQGVLTMVGPDKVP